jgi:hypothetical protein
MVLQMWLLLSPLIHVFRNGEKFYTHINLKTSICELPLVSHHSEYDMHYTDLWVQFLHPTQQYPGH